jgi:hypothetical protein
MTINFDTITNNYEVIYVIKTVMKYHLKKIDTSFYSGQRNRQGDQRGKQYNRRNYVNKENEINRLVQQLVHIARNHG